ncbi:hypothetical protein SAMN04487857_103197 [Pseudomonas sp. ok272]|uniref:dermonecrotic toxin domain-containing protein n=1 Tax=unclassified Pseudomonas TaxID=196821 RepID=UPI0008D1D73B|nr:MULTISPECIES: DUF6543 domain-containing protein [unclassified Pseudomonas]SEM61225.1 hypothetical protein SAMN04487857_103197 [Pseudomonas sp. ok272]SFM49069.1 hypothetical protein SAMN04487858_103238 [Pseudomonas sp. ok602]
MPNDSAVNSLPDDTQYPASTYALLTQLTTGPTSREVAATTLRSALKELYPTLDIDPDQAMVVTPGWRIDGDLIRPAPARYESLTSVLARQALSPQPVIYLDGEHFLTQQPDAQPVVHLPVDITAIARLINELSELLSEAFEEQQLDYWNASNADTGPRWQTLSQSLRKVWDVTSVEGWDEHDCAIARALFQFPEAATRPGLAPYTVRAYLIDIDTLRRDIFTHVGFADIAVVIGEHDQQQRILTYSLVNGYEKFESLAQLGATMPERFNQAPHDMTVQWRLFEPGGDFFDSLATTLISLQLDAIASTGSAELEDPATPSTSTPTIAHVLPVIEDLSDHTLSHIQEIHQRLPEWLIAGSDLDIATYSRYVIELANLHTQHQGQSFRDGIAPIRDYAREQLHNRLQAQPNGARLNLDQVEVVIESPVVWGTFVQPGATDITRRSLIDLALENLTGLPTGQASVLYNGGPAPEWLTYSYLKTLIESLDIGAHYPALIKRQLLDDPVQSASRQQLYSDHLRVQLPLLALQLKVQRQAGLSQQGYRYVAAAMQPQAHQRYVEGQEIVVRRLAFIPTLRPGHEQDVVANMFVIGPKDSSQGPCLLYRPLLEPVLTQFPSRQNLLYAIKHQRELRESVLAWLPEGAQFNYAQYVLPNKLPSPWTLTQALVDSQTLLYMSGPITLSDEQLGSELLATLFKDNANAMVELATRQSVSNAQKRWTSLRRAGWQIFNVALPFMGRTVGIAAWIWQIMDDLQTVEQAQDVADEPMQWTAQVNLLLDLGMALILHLALRQPRRQASRKPQEILSTPLIPLPEKPVPVPKNTTVRQTSNIVGSELPVTHQGALLTHGALNRTPASLGATLDRFKTAKPAGLDEPSQQPGPHRHLYALEGKWYAPVGERWFEVKVDDNDHVVIVDPLNHARTGPVLVRNLAGSWFVDTRLHLRGGGFRNRRRAAQQAKPSRIETLRKGLSAFDANELSGLVDVRQAHSEIGNTPGPSTNLRREVFIHKVNTRLQEYDVPIRQLRSLNIIDTVPNYQSSMIDYLGKQLLLTRSAVAERLDTFREKFTSTLDTLENENAANPKRQAASASAMSDMNQEMINRLEYAETRYRELESLGAEGLKVIQENIRALPSIKLYDLKALQVTLASYLCVGTGTGEAFASARTQIHEIVDAADLNIQSWVETVAEANITHLDERIEVLNSLAEQFAIVDQRLLDLHAQYPEQVNREPLESLRQRIDAFNQHTVRELAVSLRERKALAPKPSTSKDVTTPKRKVIKTRYNGVLVGEPHAADAGLVDVKAPMTGKIIATFHEKTPGVWVERERPSTHPRPPSAKDLTSSLEGAETLLAQEPASTARTVAHASKPGRIPVEIEEMFHQYAARLEHASGLIEHALTQLNLTESDRPSAAGLNRRLNDAAQRLYALGTQTRINMTKQQPPTATRVQWLHDQGQVKIAKVLARRRLKGPGRDYLDEYEVRDHSTHAVLWYAHFHYASPDAAAMDFTAGHLKTREQQKLGGAFQRTGLTDHDQIAVYRSEIAPALAKSLFFER